MPAWLWAPPITWLPNRPAVDKVDKRADIWSFGVLLHKLLTGKRLFAGDDVSEILAKVIRDEPDLSGVPAQFVLPPKYSSAISAAPPLPC